LRESWGSAINPNNIFTKNQIIMRLIILLIVSILITNCNTYKVHRISGIDLNSIQADSAALIRSDGLYNFSNLEAGYYGDKYKIYSPLIFLNRRKALWKSHAGFYNYNALRLSGYFNYPHSTDHIGDYVVRNDTIWAKLPILLSGIGGVLITYEAYFQGKLKNRDTILDWHMILPFPNADKKMNDNFEFFIKPNMLYFMEGKELLGLDSLYRKRLDEQEIKK
jgi:hypothetical protein